MHYLSFLVWRVSFKSTYDFVTIPYDLRDLFFITSNLPRAMMHICLLLPSVCKVFHKTKVPQFSPWELQCWRRLPRVPLIARRSNQSILRKINPEYSWKDWYWSWNSCIFVIWCEQLTHWKSPWCWERLRAEGVEDVRGWDGWMASPMQWTWTWANFGRWWGTERPGMLQSRSCKEPDTKRGLTTTTTTMPCAVSWGFLTRCMLQGTSYIQLCAHVQDFCRMNS